MRHFPRFVLTAVGGLLGLMLTNYIGSSLISKTNPSVTLYTNDLYSNAYLSDGMLNGQKVTMIVDTGAGLVSVPQIMAKKLGLKKGEPITTLTPTGISVCYRTKINTLSIGDIVLHDVDAILNHSKAKPELVLLGMSALKDLELKQGASSPVLSQLYPHALTLTQPAR